MSATKPDFSFLDRDIQSQKSLAQQALDQAKALDAQIQALPANDSARAILENAKQFQLRLARDLANNANTTTSQAAQVFRTFVSSSST